MFDRSFWVLLSLGVALRCIALHQPIVDAHLLRQCQTAAVTRSLIEEPGFALSAQIPWLGDLDARFILELPLYNYLVMGVHRLTGNLDLSGKLTSILLWAASFIVLQGLWRRFRDPKQTFWANLLFILAPLEVFYGQAFMPEMLVQLLAFGFLLLAVRYDESPTLPRWTACAVVGMVGLLVKLPELAHLYFVLGWLLIRRGGWKAIFRPRYLIAALLTAAAMKGWSSYVDSINSVHLPEWTSKEALVGFVGPLENRWHLRPWLMIAGYLGVFVAPGLATLGIAWGVWISIKRRLTFSLLKMWLLSIAVFYGLWFGSAGSGQSYYNLPTVAPLCALFGIGSSAALAWGKIVAWQRTARICWILGTFLSAAPVLTYLFKQDGQILAAALWIRDHTAPEDVVIFRPNHRYDMVDYPFNPVVSYYSGHPTFVWTDNTPQQYRRVALDRALFAVVTTPPPPPAGVMASIGRLRGTKLPQTKSIDWLGSNGFTEFTAQGGFVIYKR